MNDIHEQIYLENIQCGHTAWGGLSEAKRMDGWMPSIVKMMQNPLFPKAGKLLELGSGLGTLSHHFARAGYSVSGIEISGSAANLANQKARIQGLDATAIQGSVTNLSCFQNNFFDAIIDGNCLHCITKHRCSAFSEIFRVLKPGGFLFVSSNCGVPKLPVDLENYDSTQGLLMKDGTPFRYFAEPELILAEVRNVGFSITGYEVRQNPWWNHLVVCASK